jgi:hypothetical protein
MAILSFSGVLLSRIHVRNFENQSRTAIVLRRLRRRRLERTHGVDNLA